MASNKRKQDEKHLKMLREMVALPHNKQCFDCHQRGPTYVDMTIGSFVCTSCSGILRGLNPPHRVKSISMASFSPEEMDFLKSHGNELCRKVFLGLYDSQAWPEPDSRDEQRVRDFMVQKYENKRWYVAPTESMKEEARRMNEVSVNKPTTKPLRTLLGENTPKLVVENNQSPQMSRPQPPVSSASVAPPATSVAMPTTQPKPQATGFDLLGDIGGDPFASTPTAATGGGGGDGGFADFANFNSQPPTQAAQPSAPAPSAFPISTAPLQPMGSGAGISSAPAPVQTPTFPGTSAGDKYAALAELFDISSSPTVSTPVTQVQWSGTGSNASDGTINWSGTTTNGTGGGSINWSGGGVPASSGSSSVGWNSQSVTQTTSTAGFSSATTDVQKTTSRLGSPGNPFLCSAANPFGGSTNAAQQPGTMGTQANPFGTVGIQPGFGMPPGGAGVPPAFGQPAGGAGVPPAFGQPTASVGGFAQFGGNPPQTVSGGFGQFGMQNGGFGTTATGFGITQSAPALGGATAAPAVFGGQSFGVPAQPQGFVAQPPVFGGQPWAGQVQSTQAGNPFMNAAAQQQVPPRSSATNPFL
ncbi:arf-GAP domain and FG repeat-containing protein 1-like isoform X2 [Gigantopelta aegis]|uniref:arf-GAP domain and FG repeat-containing protein 1-like isoform X2 n=1 Tax=Gigantopelta aegis TaxID=1735272 RepID=UPI001B889158|nr:arf-GAP domain and FG repeat-containing protein 1-like isoform X2 [Gigantopelta aegis]